MKTIMLSVLLIVTTNSHASMKKSFGRAHNFHRISKGFEKIRWSKKLKEAAQEHADSCSRGMNKAGYGQNIFYGEIAPRPFHLVSSWVPSYTMYRNFYQSTWLGCAKSMCGNSKVVVCLYYPGIWG